VSFSFHKSGIPSLLPGRELLLVEEVVALSIKDYNHIAVAGSETNGVIA
jgi:hypothetical protein